MRDETEARIFLTFDDGPDPIWTPRILEALHRSRARATFFVLSPLALRFSHVVRRTIRVGHGVELHCAEHIRPEGVLVAVHWREETRTYPLQGDEVHKLLVRHTRLANLRTIKEPEYRLDVFEDA